MFSKMNAQSDDWNQPLSIFLPEINGYEDEGMFFENRQVSSMRILTPIESFKIYLFIVADILYKVHIYVRKKMK